MSNIRWISVIVLSFALSGAAVEAAAPRGGGGRPGGGGGHVGGGGHIGGGGHFAGGRVGGARVGAAHVGAARAGGFRGASRFAGGGRHFNAGRAAAVSGAAAATHLRGNNAVVTHDTNGNLSHQNAASVRASAVHASAIHHVLATQAVAGALQNHAALHNPANRAHITAVAARAGFAGHDRRGGWWRHRNGGYGWVGPLFWPFAAYDIYDYAWWGYDPSLWDYGYGDIYAGLFSPYGYGALTGYLPSNGTTASANANSAPNEIAQMCGEDSREVAGLPIDRIQQAVNPDDEQRKALDDLANASVQAAQAIKTACPTQVVSTAPARLAAMQARLEAMISAVRLVEPPLDHFYGLLNDEQKARLTALGQDQRQSRRRGREDQSLLTQGCGTGEAGVTDWPADVLQQRLNPTEEQRASLDNLRDATVKAAETLKGSCEPNEALTPPARLAAAGKRLDVMLQAVETVKSAVDDLYASLNDEQKAQFEAIGPERSGPASAAVATDDSAPVSRRHYRRYHASVVGMVRRLIGF